MKTYEQLWSMLGKVVGMGGHDLSHVRRVYKLAQKLMEKHPEADREIVTAAVILHDIARDAEDNDHAHLIDHAVLGAEQAEEILLGMDWPPDRAAWVRGCIAAHRYRSDTSAPETIEAKILYDADKLDSLGVVGVARVYQLAGQYGEPLHIEGDFTDESRARRVHDYSRYSANVEYYAKLRHIPQKLFTDEARRIAAVRMKKMDDFFAELERELSLADV